VPLYPLSSKNVCYIINNFFSLFINENIFLGSYTQPDKVYTMSLAGDKLVVGTAGRHVWIWDIRYDL
jgi:hypothetical protein